MFTGLRSLDLLWRAEILLTPSVSWYSHRYYEFGLFLKQFILHMKKIHLRVCLPKNRDLMGHLRVEIDGFPVDEFRVLGRGSRGPGETSMLSRGNTPTGSYQGDQLVDTEDWPQSSYGPWGAVRLQPSSGDAILAEQFGRRGLLIHGGSPGTKGPWAGSLKPTHGCLRLSNEDMRKLRGWIEGARDDGFSCVATSTTVTVEEW